MNESEISGNVSVTGDGQVYIEAYIHATDTHMNMEVTLEESRYLIRFTNCHMGSTIVVNDVIEARVEIADVLRTNYYIDDEEIIEHCKGCIEQAWRDPFDSFCMVKNMLVENEGDPIWD